ncbi:putative polysaccharide biosynthesis protein [Isobaculum melis]|uniref:Polysaccharide transporter, PST family n=1 Tax=Isobaculum melis TaxID=142588 RepID=A0A1H9SMK6_9LACT|nr:polysaccharide biosynthesis protein [Isobaculum melis]SER86157.1 polysaccharide transporter, PST family [Isobaculum melis]
MANKEMKHLMKGAIVLSIAGFIAKFLSAIYRVPFQNMVGDVGFYVYQQVYPIYGIGMTFALTGLPVFMSKLVAETKDGPHLKRMLRNAFFIVSVFSIVITIGLYALSDYIALQMGDAQLSSLIKAVSPMFLCMPLLVIGRGYFQGRYEMRPTAVSQVVEQIVRVAVILIAAAFFLKGGMTYYQMGSNAMSSAWIAGVFASLILLYYYVKNKQTIQLDLNSKVLNTEKEGISMSELFKRFATEGIAICLFGAMLVLLQLVDSFTLYNGLLDGGASSIAAQIAKGVYDRGQPLVQLGMVVGTGFASSLIPMLTRYFVVKKQKEFIRTSASLLRITITFSVAATVGLITLLPYVNRLLFSTNSGAIVLAIYVLAIILASLIVGCNTILQSQDRHKPALLSLIVCLGSKVVLNMQLVPLYGTIGASISTVTSLLLMLIILWKCLPKEVRLSVSQKGFLWKLFLCCVAMVIIVYALSFGLVSSPIGGMGRMGDFIIAIGCVLAGAGAFLWLMIRLKLFTLKEWISLPFGKKILRK